MRLRLTHAPTSPSPFGAEPESITITANPATAVDVHAIGAFDRLPLELIEQDVVAHRPVMHRVTLYVWERRLSGLLRHGRYERRQLAASGRPGRRRVGLGLFLLVAACGSACANAGALVVSRRPTTAANGGVAAGHSSTRTSRNMPASM